MADETQDPPEYWYRVDGVREASWDFYSECITGYDYRITVMPYRVVKHTRAGVRLDVGSGKTKFVLNDARRRFAYPTADLAMDSYRVRKLRQCQILEANLKHAQRELAMAKHYINNEQARDKISVLFTDRYKMAPSIGAADLDIKIMLAQAIAQKEER